MRIYVDPGIYKIVPRLRSSTKQGKNSKCVKPASSRIKASEEEKRDADG
jgi:hypothetical protein